MEGLSNRITAWLTRISSTESLPKDIEAIYIGLFEGEHNYNIYFSGSKGYDPEDDDWACNQDFEPQFKYLDSGIGTSMDWQAFKAKVIDTIKIILEGDTSSILHNASHVSVGFDGGNLTHIK
ncbi:MAG: hypothetical protein ACYS83_08215 [Planctomycetota bacterium]|jgi:hypothetical protein